MDKLGRIFKNLRINEGQFTEDYRLITNHSKWVRIVTKVCNYIPDYNTSAIYCVSMQVWFTTSKTGLDI